VIELLVAMAVIGLLVGPKVVTHFSRSKTVGTGTPATSTAPAAPAAPATGFPKKLWWVLIPIALVALWFFPPWSWFDWADTVPGKAIEKWLGQGTANWVIWSALVVFVLFFVRDLVSKDKKLGNVLNVLYFCAAAVIAAMLFGGTLQTYDKLTEQKVTSHIEFRGVHKAKPKVVVMAFNTIAVASLDMGHVSTGPNWACPETIKPAKLPFDVYYEVVAGKGTTQNHIQLTKESQQALLENGTMAVTVRFTHQTEYQNPCVYLRVPA
jgi:hypothetical protein